MLLIRGGCAPKISNSSLLRKCLVSSLCVMSIIVVKCLQTLTSMVLKLQARRSSGIKNYASSSYLNRCTKHLGLNHLDHLCQGRYSQYQHAFQGYPSEWQCKQSHPSPLLWQLLRLVEVSHVSMDPKGQLLTLSSDCSVSKNSQFLAYKVFNLECFPSIPLLNYEHEYNGLILLSSYLHHVLFDSHRSDCSDDYG